MKSSFDDFKSRIAAVSACYPSWADYRRWLSLFSFEGQKPQHGTFVSDDIRDYYVSPYELGYGKSIAIAFNHDFIGRAALEKARDHVRRTKVTLAFNPDDVREVFGSDPGYVLSYARYRVNRDRRPRE